MITMFEEIRSYIAQCGGNYPTWYVGIASDPSDRLFNGHRVNSNGDAWIYRDCVSSISARQTEQRLLAQGCKGGGGGGDSSTRFVYAYRINAHTSEN